MLNPVTQVRYENKDEFIQSLIDVYVKVKDEQKSLDADESLAIAELITQSNADKPVEPLGSVLRSDATLIGTTKEIKLKARENITYPKRPGDEDSPLVPLISKYPKLIDMLNVKYEETAAIKTLLNTPDEALDDEMKQMKIDLLEIRRSSFGKPEIKVKDL